MACRFIASRSGIDHGEKAAFPRSTPSFNNVENVTYAPPSLAGGRAEAQGREDHATAGPRVQARSGMFNLCANSPSAGAGKVAVLDGGWGPGQGFPKPHPCSAPPCGLPPVRP